MLSLYLWSGLVTAAPRQDHAAIRAAAYTYAHQQTRALPGEVSIKIGAIDPRLALKACPVLRAYLPAGAKLHGNTSIGVRCNAPNGWTILVPAKISVTLDLLVSNKPLTQGSTLSTADFTLQRGEMDRPGLLISPQQAIGQIVKYALGAGQVLRTDMLRAPNVIRQGQTVTLTLPGKGYLVSSEGHALNDAGAGSAVRIRLATGQVVLARATASGSAELAR
ncbi:MAG: flagellar basal body P-ring formation chaperone FlgA [Sideroxyarcus sp.]|nr:flagellar basal body P-ring formation chaperone FlgA [Sideroxyarcus sp.]